MRFNSQLQLSLKTERTRIVFEVAGGTERRMVFQRTYGIDEVTGIFVTPLSLRKNLIDTPVLLAFRERWVSEAGEDLEASRSPKTQFP